MVPISLKLQNFLSYGTACEPLDFERFHVACLSGGNGQGKSALLDAITWAIWGEARKAAGTRKPDAELLRIGTREMSVELVFELEGERYRATRGYQRSATGRSDKSTLEFQVWDAEAATFRPLTGSTLRETQEAIDRTLGIDYETFINSAFLLQGRSDEFTKKKPGERKEILGRILGLDRYERLAVAARARHSEATAKVRELEAERERLLAALEEEDAWKAEREEVRAAAAALEAEREEARSQEAALAERLAELEALARAAEERREQLERLAERDRSLEAERAELAARIAEAETLSAERESIERDHARYETLAAERRDLDERADLRRGLEAQLAERKLALERQRMEAEGRLKGIEAELQAGTKSRAEHERRLAERPRLEQAAERARKAEAEAAELRRKAEERRQTEGRLHALDKQLANEQGARTARLAQLKQQLREAEAGAEALPTLRSELARLRTEAEALREAQQALAEVKEHGSALAAQIEGMERERERLGRQIEAVEARVARLHALETETCPTCGTPLTEEHRVEVERSYREEAESLRAERARTEADLAEKTGRRDALRARYREVHAEVARHDGLAERLARGQAEAERAEAAAAALAEQRAQLAALAAEIQEGTFRPDLRAERAELLEALEAEPFDREHFERVQAEAARRQPAEEQLRALELVQGEYDELARRLERQEREAAALRESLAEGRAFAPLQQQIHALQQQLERVGYDGARHEAVRRELEGLRGAPERLIRLAAAERNLTDWSARLGRIEAERAAGEAEASRLRSALAEAEAELGARPGLEAQRHEAATRGAEAEARLSQAQARLGGLEERLERCARERERLGEVRAQRQEAGRQRALYDHLRRAFSKNGIPALIIEETLPEVEERANALLERLANGRTRVHLETLGDKRTGGTKETLDIRITDEGGVQRPYETYSGGEAFRVDFALRIALAQLLAERSGVRIRSLVIDEGFGTQDKQGIENLVEAIQAIREDFDKVLVITHLDELKEAFPVRIEVRKDPVEGSQLQMMGV